MMAADPFYEEFGRLLKNARGPQAHRPRMTQAHLADALGLSRPSVANIEKGRQPVQLHIVVRMAEVLGVEVGSLIPQRLPVLISTEGNLAIAALQGQGASENAIRRALLHLPKKTG